MSDTAQPASPGPILAPATQNAQIRSATFLIAIEPAPAQIGYVRASAMDSSHMK